MEAVRFASDNMTDAVALTNGRIQNWYVGKNSAVHKGDILLSMNNEQIPLKIQQSNSSVRKAEAVLAQAYSAYQRQCRLIAKKATSQEKYEAAEAQYLAAQEALHEAEAQRAQNVLQQEWLNVTSPVDGEVLIIYQREGAAVQAGMPVALVGNFDRLKFSLNLADADTRHLQVGDKALLTFPDRWTMGKAYDTDYGAGNQGWNQKVSAQLLEVVPPLSEPADVRRAVWEVDNRTRLLEPMTYTGVTMQMSQSYHCLTVPLKAMVDAARNKVFVIDENGILHLKEVTVGSDDGKNVEIYSGLSAGDIVVVDSMEGLAEGMKAEIILEGENG
jgi:RND family efflux transporter MFP subunit